MRVYPMCLAFAFVSLASMPALGDTYFVAIGDDCDPFLAPFAGCFAPNQLTIHVGDYVQFYSYTWDIPTGYHNVVADDGSFRCARGCDGEGGDGTPVSGFLCKGSGCTPDPTLQVNFSRQFNVPGVVSYHDEVGGATGVITVLAAQGAPPFAIGPGVTGAWYDPAQSGHGLFIEVLPNKRLYAAWFTFSPDGSQQAWFSGVGTYAGNTAVLPTVEQPTGGRWIPNFDPSQVVRNVWGTLTFTFTDCNHGRVDFTSPTAYGSGSMNLTRLTEPDGLACQ